jgi:hypothetical protein
MQLNLKHPLLGMGNQGLDLNTGTELHINSWMLQWSFKRCGRIGLYWQGNQSSAGIMSISSTCWVTNLLKSITDSTQLFTETILPSTGWFSRTAIVTVCKGQSGWTVGTRIPSVESTNNSDNLSSHGCLYVQSWNDYYNT